MTEPREAFAGATGVPDYLRPQSSAFVAVRDTMLGAARRAGYGDIELPIFEDTALFARGVGESTDVVAKEMYTFADRGDRSVTLRPEGTAGVVRAVIEHHLDRGALPVKLCYAGPFFRYERPQAGRYRQLQQVGVEAIGVDDPALDAEVIAVADTAFRSLGLTGFRLEITSLGDETCRPAYRERLQEFLFGLDLDDETRRRAEINPLRVLDDKRPAMREMTAAAPVLLDHLSESARAHFDTVLAHLDALGVPYVINPRMVRGLDYYTKTTFEFVHDGLGAQSGIGGGGRYDGLMARLGGADLSGIGFGLGVDRTLLALAAEGHSVGAAARCEVFGVPLGQRAKAALAVVAADLRAHGIGVDLAYGDRGLKGAMRAADRSGAVVALVAGDRDLDAGTVGVKDLVAGTQTDVALAEVRDTVAALLRAGRSSAPGGARRGCNAAVACLDMAYMRKTTTIGAALMVAAAGVAVSNATAGADPDGGHEVTYTITAADSLVAKIYYISADPPSMAEYNADSTKYLTSVQQPIAPGEPLVYTATLNDPGQWARVDASGALRVPPNFGCEIAVDGEVVVSQQGGSGVTCATGQW